MTAARREELSKRDRPASRQVDVADEVPDLPCLRVLRRALWRQGQLLSLGINVLRPGFEERTQPPRDVRTLADQVGPFAGVVSQVEQQRAAEVDHQLPVA